MNCQRGGIRWPYGISASRDGTRVGHARHAGGAAFRRLQRGWPEPDPVWRTADPGLDPARRRGSAGSAAEQRDAAVAQLAEYFAGKRRGFDLFIDWSVTSSLQQQVLRMLTDSVGYGETVSYGALARRVGHDSFGASPPARAVGQIMGSNPIPVVVPCHRVVAADGLGGYSGGTGTEVKRWLLTLEGALPPTLDWDAACLRA